MKLVVLPKVLRVPVVLFVAVAAFFPEVRTASVCSVA